ncbi:MASE1 domain-containing protein [Candidatus Daviesbacteria bacterium]|nr:MASE1 domain-containing protein [Candidatus Daviesbacteria bacterium]
MPKTADLRDLAYLIKVLIIFTAYFFTARLGLTLDAVSGFATLVWLPTGLSLAALLIFGFKIWPGIFLGAFLANLTIGAPPLVALGIGTGNTLEAVLAAYFLKRLGFNNSLDTLKDVIYLVIAAAFFSTMVSATIGVFSLLLGGIVTSKTYAATWIAWWMGDLISDLVVVPLLLVWSTRFHFTISIKRLIEAIVLSTLLVFAGLAVFGGLLSISFKGRPVAYLVFPLLIWAVFRFGVRGAVSATFILSVIAIYSTILGFGPFSVGPLHENLWFLQLFVAVMSITAMTFAAIAHEGRRANEKLQSNERRFRALIEKASDAIFLVDKKGSILYASPSSSKIIGYTPQELVGQICFVFARSSDPKNKLELSKLFKQLLKQPNASITAASRALHQDGSWKWIEATATNLLHDSSVKAIVVNFRDVTERKEVEERKDEFISIASHELRTPLATVKGYTQILGQLLQSKDDKLTGYISKMAGQIDRLTKLVADLLDVSQIQAGKLELHKSKFNMDSLVSEVVDNLQLTTQHRILFQPDGQAKIYADKDRISEVLINLMTNAIKYSPRSDKILVRVNSDTSHVNISVQDFGIGISKKHISHLFERFFRAENRIRSSFSGLGLGLYISQRIIKRHGGEIKADSIKGQGSTFTVNLPIKE